MRLSSLRLIYVSLFLVSALIGNAQTNGATLEEKELVPPGQKGSPVFKMGRLLESQSETLDITGTGAPIFTVSNTADGTAESFNHHFRITYNLQVLNGKGNYQLHFYGAGEKIPYAVNNENGVTAIYMPLAAHDYFRVKVEQALNLKKKVQLKINLLTSGFREAVWIL
jgi:hypothetical protein